MKGQVGFRVAVWIIIIGIAVAAIASTLILPVDVKYSIQLKNQQIEKGEDLVLYFTVHNDLPQKIDHVNLSYEISSQPMSNFTFIGDVAPSQTYRGSIKVNTLNMNEGEYRISTELTYLLNGTWNSKELSLKFEVFCAPDSLAC